MATVRVLSYNVRSLRDDRAALVRVVRSCAPDLFVVQEAPRAVRWRSRCAALARECGLVYVAGGRTGGGNLLLATVEAEVEEAVERQLPRRLGRPLRGLVGARVRVRGARMRIVGAHLGLRPAERRQQVRLALAAAAALGSGPPVLAGDLNEPPGGPSWRAFAGAGLADPAPETAPPTFPSRRRSGSAGPRARRIDAVLTGPGVGVAAYGAAPAEGSDLARASDHLPVLAVLTV